MQRTLWTAKPPSQWLALANVGQPPPSQGCIQCPSLTLYDQDTWLFYENTHTLKASIWGQLVLAIPRQIPELPMLHQSPFQTRLCHLGIPSTFVIEGPSRPFPWVFETWQESPNGMTLNWKTLSASQEQSLVYRHLSFSPASSHWPSPSRRNSLHPKRCSRCHQF